MSPGSKPGGSADSPNGHLKPSPGVEPGELPLRGPPDAGPEGLVRSAGFEPATSSISGWPLCHVGVRAHRALGRDRTAGLSLTRRPLLPSELQGHGYRGRNRTCVLLGQGQGGMPATHPVPSTGGEIRTRTRARFGLAVSAVGLRPQEPGGLTVPAGTVPSSRVPPHADHPQLGHASTGSRPPVPLGAAGHSSCQATCAHCLARDAV